MNRERSQEGAVLVLVAVSMIVILGLAALVIDLGYLYLTKNQLHVAADGAALAGAAQIVDTSDCGGTVGFLNYPARTEALTFAAFHNAGSQSGQTPVTLALNTSNDADGDIVLGNFTRSRDPQFLPCPTSDGSSVNAVRVRARRTDEFSTDATKTGGNPPAVFFGAIFPFQIQNVTAEAIAKAPDFVLLWSGEEVEIRENVTINGDIYSGGDVEVRDSTVTGNVFAVGEIDNEGTITGTVNPGSSSRPMPFPPNHISYYQNLCGVSVTCLTGDQKPLSLAVYNGKTVFVDGDVEISGDFSAGGPLIVTLVAMGRIKILEGTEGLHLFPNVDRLLFLSGDSPPEVEEEGRIEIRSRDSSYEGLIYVSSERFREKGSKNMFRGAIVAAEEIRIRGEGTVVQKPTTPLLFAGPVALAR